MPAFLKSSSWPSYFAIMSDSFFGTEEPDKDTVVVNCLAVVIGIMPAEIGSAMLFFFAFSKK